MHVAKKRVHRIPHEAVRTILVQHGIDSVGKALQFGEANEISPKSIEGIIRGKRKLGVEFELVDRILCALDSPDHWYLDLAPYYYPPHAKHEHEYETFLPQWAAFERACELMQGVDVGLVFAA